MTVRLLFEISFLALNSAILLANVAFIRMQLLEWRKRYRVRHIDLGEPGTHLLYALVDGLQIFLSTLLEEVRVDVRHVPGIC